jgi:predicted metal-binding membrane protein
MAESSNQSILLSPAETQLRRALLRPRRAAIVSLALLAGLGWLYLGLMAGEAVDGGHGLGPGTSVLRLIADGQLDAAGRALLASLCRPTFADAGHIGIAGWTGGSLADLALIALMWGAMIFAMMLPTAGPMIVAYAEIAEAAAAKREAAVSPLMLTAGYLAVWLGFALVATALQWGMMRLALLDGSLATASPLFAGAIFIAAGAYQFSALKHACITLCQRPFPFFLAHWSTERAAIFRLGLRQGLYCVGCCWAMMLVMFAVGVMNILWMAVMGVIMGVEKILGTTRFSRAVGVAFLAIGVGIIASSVAAQWPVRAEEVAWRSHVME